MKTMRDKTTGEFRDVDEDEFKQLIREVTSDGFPKWEQTSYAHADNVLEKATYGELLEEHLGQKYQDALKHAALILDAEEVAPEHNPHLQLTPGEIEEGLSPEDKLEQIRTQYAESVPRREEIFRKAHEKISPEGLKSKGDEGPSRGLRARAGGSEERPNKGSKSQAERVAAGSEETDEEKLAGEALKNRANELNIEGRSSMSADELRDAVAKAEGGQ